MRLIVRGFAGRSKVFEEFVESDGHGPDFDALVKRQLMRLLGYSKHMFEIEFLDEPDPLQRFFRFGNDPGGMTMPIKIEGNDER